VTASATPVVALALLVLAATSALAAETSTRKLSVGGGERSYILSRPATKDPRPTIIVLHGGTLDAQNALRTTGFEALVDREKLVVAYPDAIAGHWNDGRSLAQGRWQTGNETDVSFIRPLAGTLVQLGLADPQRIYVTGPSNGGMMTLRLVCEAADLFAAAAPIIANLPADLAPRCRPARPIPVLVMNGTADPLMPFGGGEVGLRYQRGQVISTEATMALLRKIDGCADTPSIEHLPDTDPSDGSNVTVESWTNCSSGAPVVLYQVDGGGHRVPRRNQPARPVMDRTLGKANGDFEAADAIWAFFKDKTR